MVYLTPILWFKNYRLCIGFQILPDTSFASVKIISAFVDTDLEVDDKDGVQEQRTHLISLLAAKIFRSTL